MQLRWIILPLTGLCLAISFQNCSSGNGLTTPSSVAAGTSSAITSCTTKLSVCLYYPEGIVSDGSSLFVNDTGNNVIRKVDLASGNVTILAGQVGVSGAADGPGASATFGTIVGMTTDGTNLYVSEAGSVIRKIVIATGEVSTFVTATSGLAWPRGMTIDGTNLYVANSNSNQILQVSLSTGVVTVLAGNGSMGYQDGAATSAEFNNPYDVATDGTNIYVSDSGNAVIRQINLASGMVSTLAGKSHQGGWVDGVGANARFNSLYFMTIIGSNLYVFDNATIRQINIPTATVTTLVGSPGNPGLVDGVGSAALIGGEVFGITNDGTNLYFSDTMNYYLREVTLSTKTVTTF